MSKSSSKVVSQTSPLNKSNASVIIKDATSPDFIYGGPFIEAPLDSPFLNTATPFNEQLQGIYTRSFAYYSLKDRLPVILTKVIDYLSRESEKIKSAHGASDEDIRGLIEYISKLKNDLITNKTYDLLTVDTPEAKKWNQYIDNAQSQFYFTNVWVFSECYVYRRLIEGCELSKGLQNFDPFGAQKEEAFANSLEPMCVVADKLISMLGEERVERKSDFITLLKICLWSNKCDLSLSSGEQVSFSNDSNDTSRKLVDPFQMILDFKDKLLVDDSSKVYDQVVAKAEAMAKAIEANANIKAKCSCHRLAALAGMKICKKETEDKADMEEVVEVDAGAEDEEPEPSPCPAKMIVPQAVMFDIVCDNSGYELFSDLCLAHFLIAHNIVQKVRFHVKKIPWFVSDVTLRDFEYVIKSCAQASYSVQVPDEPKPAAQEPEPENPQPEAPKVLNSDNLNKLGEEWLKYYNDGAFVVLADDFWTSPHVYKDMKKHEPTLYRELQFTVAILFKGDLNYRKLLGERNCVPTLGFDPALQGFIPAPIIAVRTVKADLICGLPKGKYDQLNKLDEKWMEKGDYGVIQFNGKCEALKPSERPCGGYGHVCFGGKCTGENS